MRLNKYLARCGLASRRKCDEYIEAGLIRINGDIMNNFSYNVKENDFVQFNNKIVNYVDEDYFYILNKPRGYICSSNDPKNRKKIFDLVPSDIRLFYIGRLDYNSTGIILLTNNGDLANNLLHPKYNIKKKYYVETEGGLNSKHLEMIKIGINDSEVGKIKADIKLLKKDKNIFIWDISLTEGKNREIRRIFKFFGCSINKLHRYEFGGINLGKIKSGKFKKISYKNVKKFLG